MRINAMDTTTAQKSGKGANQATVANLHPVAAPANISAAHKPFSWLCDEAQLDGSARFLEKTFDVCSGIVTCLELVQSSNMERSFNVDADPGTEQAPILNENDTERLLRLAIASAQLIADVASEKIGFKNECAKKAVAA
jgi:hypothetical protein